MRFRSIVLVPTLALAIGVGCKKEEKEEKKVTIQPQILRLPVTESFSMRDTPYHMVDPAEDSSLMQSFTPTSIRLSVSDISVSGGALDDWNGPRSMVYSCPGATNEECMVEVSDLAEFEDALNAKAAELEPGTYTKVAVGMCKEINGQQHIEIAGHATLNGKTYITSTAAEGIVEGAIADATPVLFKFSGCAVQIPLATPINAELSDAQRAEAEKKDCTECAPTVEADIGLRLVFDTFNFAAMGNMLNDATKQLVANAADNLEAYPFNEDDAACKGDKAGLFLCTQRTALYATDDRVPAIKRYAITLTSTDAAGSRAAVATPEPTAYTGLILRSDNELIAAYTRRSVNEGAKFNLSQKGDENYFLPGKNADGSFKLSEGASGEQLTYPAFKLENHSGTRAGLAPDSEVAYQAILME